MTRMCIYPKDISLITGKSERWGRNLIEKIKAGNQKAKHQLVEKEFCFYSGLSASSVEKRLFHK
jgi:hypothetical protein